LILAVLVSKLKQRTHQLVWCKYSIHSIWTDSSSKFIL
jgi:hypothetical protein